MRSWRCWLGGLDDGAGGPGQRNRARSAELAGDLPSGHPGWTAHILAARIGVGGDLESCVRRWSGRARRRSGRSPPRVARGLVRPPSGRDK
jgi:hypothetical protein